MTKQILTSVQQVASGKTPLVLVGQEQEGPPRVVFPGSFNPLHTGHRKIASVAATVIGGPVYYELSIDNVEKPSISATDVVRRLDQFDATETVAITRAVTFGKKVLLFPGVVFAIGIDTLSRIGAAKYYDTVGQTVGEDRSRNPEKRMQKAIDQIAQQGCRLLVFGRKIGSDFCSLGDISIPPTLSRLCLPVPETLFREDISSSDFGLFSGSDTQRNAKKST